MSSANKINYSVRLNKSIERKIISESILTIKSLLNLNYSYIGFGSLWFTDFIYFHKYLNIQEMYSIERDKIIFDRAVYNVPYNCIKVIHGESSKELSNVLDQTSLPSIVWLDYDNMIFDCTSFQPDVDTIVSQSKNGSILLVTMNVNNSRVKAFRNNISSSPDAWKNQIKDLLKQTFGLVDLESVENTQLTDPAKFINFVNPLFSETIGNSIYRSGNKKSFKKIFDFSYADNAEMVTQGFLLFDASDNSNIEKLLSYQSNYFINDTPFRIEAPLLTNREKYSVDQKLPSQDINSFIDETGTFEDDSLNYLNPGPLGFPININNLKSYAELYKFYPTFSEIMSS